MWHNSMMNHLDQVKYRIISVVDFKSGDSVAFINQIVFIPKKYSGSVTEFLIILAANEKGLKQEGPWSVSGPC